LLPSEQRSADLLAEARAIFGDELVVIRDGIVGENPIEVPGK
jgi:hypothetical protein